MLPNMEGNPQGSLGKTLRLPCACQNTFLGRVMGPPDRERKRQKERERDTQRYTRAMSRKSTVFASLLCYDGVSAAPT